MTSVGSARAAVRRHEEVMGTVVSFDVRPGAADGHQVFLALAEARARLHRADAVFSTWKEHSPMSLVRRGEIAVADAPPEVATVLGLCEAAKRASQGWFDPWSMPGGVDPSGLVKGWATERALLALTEAGVEAAMVNAGGDVALVGAPDAGEPWRIGIRDPWDGARLVTVVSMGGHDRAVATSGSYERGHHVLDPTTAMPSRSLVSATVTGPDLALADAFATGLLAAGEAGLAWVPTADGYQALVVGPEGSVVHTSGFPFA